MYINIQRERETEGEKKRERKSISSLYYVCMNKCAYTYVVYIILSVYMYIDMYTCMYVCKEQSVTNIAASSSSTSGGNILLIRRLDRDRPRALGTTAGEARLTGNNAPWSDDAA